jgi:hypothetical protein
MQRRLKRLSRLPLRSDMLRESSGRSKGVRYEIEFYRWTETPNKSEVLRRHSADFADLNAARAYGIANTGTPDNSEAADGFTIRENGVVISDFIQPRPTSA